MTEGLDEISVTITALEMRARPKRPLARAPSLADPVMLLHAVKPTVSYYRFLYNTIGQDWLWYERREMSDAEVAKIIHDDRVAVFVLYLGGVPAGYAEIDSRKNSEVEIAYLGLMSEFIGRGLGRYLVEWAIDTAWENEPERVWIHTCDLDHPAALPLYQKAGFTAFRQNTVQIPNPRKLPSFASTPPGERQTDPGPDQ